MLCTKERLREADLYAYDLGPRRLNSAVLHWDTPALNPYVYGSRQPKNNLIELKTLKLK